LKIEEMSRGDKIVQLHQLFGSDKLTRSFVGEVLDSCGEDFDEAVSALINISEENEPLKTMEQLENEKSLEIVQNMFSDLSQSVVSIVYHQNQGDIVQAVDTLLNISNDEEAIESIRKMNTEQKKKLEVEMQKEHENRLQERQERLQREIGEEKLTIAEMEKKFNEEQKEAVSFLDPLNLVEEEVEQQPDIYRLMKEKEELQHKLKRAEKESKKNKKRRDELEKMQEEMRQEIKKQIDKKREDIKQKELLVSKICQQKALCTLSTRYGTNTIIVSWSLGSDMKSLPGDWIGFYRVGQPPQKYLQYIS